MVKFPSEAQADQVVREVQRRFGYDSHTRQVKGIVFVNGVYSLRDRVLEYVRGRAKEIDMGIRYALCVTPASRRLFLEPQIMLSPDLYSEHYCIGIVYSAAGKYLRDLSPTSCDVFVDDFKTRRRMILRADGTDRKPWVWEAWPDLVKGAIL